MNAFLAIFYWKKHKLHFYRLFCCNHTCYCVGMGFVTSAVSVTLWKKMLDVHTRSDSTELAEAGPIRRRMLRRAVSPDRSLLILTQYGCIWRLRPEFRPLSPLNASPWAFRRDFRRYASIYQNPVCWLVRVETRLDLSVRRQYLDLWGSILNRTKARRTWCFSQ